MANFNILGDVYMYVLHFECEGFLFSVRFILIEITDLAKMYTGTQAKMVIYFYHVSGDLST